MSIRRIAVFGATGMLGRPVAKKLLEAGYDVTIVAREPSRATGFEGASIVRGDILDADSVRTALAGADAAYLNLSIAPGASKGSPHAETDGLRNVLDAARHHRLRRVALISSLVMNYQGTNGFHWWAFDVKREAVAIIKGSGVGWNVFYPSSFMENFTGSQKQGDRIMLAGTSRFPMWFVAGDDYGAQVARAFALDAAANRDFPVQGPEPVLVERAAEDFVRHYTKERLRISRSPLWPLRLVAPFSGSMSYLWHIVEALNNYDERFVSQETWDTLGRPATTIAEFARKASA